MTVELEKNNCCPLCGGGVRQGRATMPFVFPDTVVLIKDVPADVCESCHEPYVTGRVTDRLTNVLNQLRRLHVEVSIISYKEAVPAPVSVE